MLNFKKNSAVSPNMPRCKICGKESEEISKTLKVCLECIRKRWDKAFPWVENAHAVSRKSFGLPVKPPADGAPCGLCVNNCKIKENCVGYCGVRTNKNGKIKSVVDENAVVECYYDTLPTNCVSMNFCSNRDLGSPYKNLAVFYAACSFNCLFCQNWHYREILKNWSEFHDADANSSHFLLHNRNINSNAIKNLKPVMSPGELAEKVDEHTRCVCYFGGDPTPQIIHAIKTSEIIIKNNDNVRICWETNGSMNRNVLEKAAKISMKTGGTIKFDLKAFDEKLNIALCGVTNKQTIANFKFLEEYNKNAGYHFLTASTLLVPGYIDKKEVENIAKFISSIDDSIPYCLLGFYPHFYMDDMPLTSKKQAYECLEIAEKHLKNVRIGNLHLLNEKR